ncbi:MAG: CD225/dispanin family protein [Terracoccus sp.]
MPHWQHWRWAILVTMFCFLPFGVVSIVKASSVNTLWAQRRWPEAHAAAASARTLGDLGGLGSLGGLAMATLPRIFVCWVALVFVAVVG